MNRAEIVCIACPRGCRLAVSSADRRDDDTLQDDNLLVEGNQCRKGIDYGRQEVLQPRRMLTTTVKTLDPRCPRLSVRLSAEIPKARLLLCMKTINTLVISRSCRPGDVLYENINEEGVDLIATGGLDYEG